MSDTELPVDPLESWEDGAAFGVADDKDPICTQPVGQNPVYNMTYPIG